MRPKPFHQCQCQTCQSETDRPEKMIHHQINGVLSRLDEQQRRWYAAVEANRHGHGGTQLVSQITGLDEKTVRRGQKELNLDLVDRPDDRMRLPGAGRPLTEEKDPTVEDKLMELVRDDMAGEPQTGQRWVRKSLGKIQQDLDEQKEVRLSCETIRRLLGKRDIRPRSNVKRLQPKPHPDRDKQFRYLTGQKAAFLKAGWPCISVDTKKKELLGLFYNRGTQWCQEAQPVNTHDFPSYADGRAIP